jgi:hypothetical protein
MLGVWGEYADAYLWVVAVGSLFFFGLPICFFPLRWASWLRWQIPEHVHLSIYLGRCLGAVICVMAIFALQATRSDPAILHFYFNFMLVNVAAMIIVHIYGALKKIQPLSETIEIAYWILLFLMTLCFHPGFNDPAVRGWHEVFITI